MQQDPSEPTPRPASRSAGLSGLFTLAALAGGAFLLYRNAETWSRSLLLYLSGAKWMRALVTNFGPAWKFAKRFVAGETVDEAIVAAAQLNARGMSVTMDFLGESVSSVEEANAARDQILWLLDRMHSSHVDANVSLKLSQLGLKIDENAAIQNLRAILIRAQQYKRRVRIDMEESALVDVTLDIYRRLCDGEGFGNVGVVIQAYLYRSEADVERLVAEGAWVRLVKGAYKEPHDIAFALKTDTDANMVKLMQRMLSADALRNGVYLAMATHDEKLIAATQEFARKNQIPADKYEFQFLYGIRRELQEQLVAQGNQVRIYVPYGTAWYPYFMRRLAERPANVWFFVSNYFRA